MKPTFHIIEKIFRVLEWDILLYDIYGNIIHLPKHFIVNKGFKILEKKTIINSIDGIELPEDAKICEIDNSIEGLELPFFVLANVKEYKNKEGKKLVGFVVFTKISQLISVYTDNITLELNSNTANDDINYSLTCIQQIIIEFENYIHNKSIDNKHLNYDLPIDYNTLNELELDYFQYLKDLSKDVNYDDLLILRHQNSKVFPWIDYLDSKIFNFLSFPEGYFKTEHEYGSDEAEHYPNSVEIITIPLFRYRLVKNHDSYLASQKIITIDEFKSFDKTLDFPAYLDQFYYLEGHYLHNKSKQSKFSLEPDSKYYNGKYLSKYKRECYSEYRNKLHKKFNTNFVYAIQPHWHHDMNKDTLEKLHGHVIKLVNALLDSGIRNLVINPPINDIDYVIEMEEHSQYNSEMLEKSHWSQEDIYFYEKYLDERN